MKVAVVGVGKMGLLHAGILNVLSNGELVALCEKNSLIRRFLKKVFKKAWVIDEIEKLCDLDLDAIYVTTPVSSHSFIIKNVYSKGIARNIFVEKPLASSYRKAEEICRMSQTSGGINMVGYMKRFAVTFRKAKELLNENVLGELTSFKAYAYSSDFFGYKNTLKASAYRGGVLGDLGCHVIDLALWFFGDFAVDLAEIKSMTGGSSEDFAYIKVRRADGLVGELHASWCMKNYRLPEFGFLIKGSKGTMRVNDDMLELRLKNGKSTLWYRHDLGDSVSFWLGAPEYVREDEFFVKAVLKGHNIEPNFQTASRVNYIIDEVRHRGNRNE